jgi:hypothetical protein
MFTLNGTANMLAPFVIWRRRDGDANPRFTLFWASVIMMEWQHAQEDRVSIGKMVF